MKNKIVMVGLGVMGMPMARNILKSGLDLSCCDVNWDSSNSERLSSLIINCSQKVAKIEMLPSPCCQQVILLNKLFLVIKV